MRYMLLLISILCISCTRLDEEPVEKDTTRLITFDLFNSSNDLKTISSFQSIMSILPEEKSPITLLDQKKVEKSIQSLDFRENLFATREAEPHVPHDFQIGKLYTHGFQDVYDTAQAFFDAITSKKDIGAFLLDKAFLHLNNDYQEALPLPTIRQLRIGSITELQENAYLVPFVLETSSFTAGFLYIKGITNSDYKILEIELNWLALHEQDNDAILFEPASHSYRSLF